MKQIFNNVVKQKYSKAVIKEAKLLAEKILACKSKKLVHALPRSLAKKGWDIVDVVECVLMRYDTETEKDMFDACYDGEITVYVQRVKEQIKRNEEIEARLNEIVKGMKLDGKTELEKARAVVDKTCELLEYCNEEGINGYPKHMHTSTYELVMNGCCVCNGYARMFCMLCDKVGLESRYLGNTDHAWNRVMIGGKWLYVDCTWDDFWVRVTDWSLKPNKVFYGELKHPKHTDYNTKCWIFKGV